ncbi:hypothetical protein EDC94DRAFT_654836 [Helicostylum pulchrum]|uniref:Phosphatidic acid phosphatase type 2/haloperoxidase domain-containing protein n=1 Tax=Helicostylum pulchrum TaxID=562976 RepID=A0ABP9XV76_9FUNG|nr:hypothetical protein EDC94DRAFT_654836 [Helicostylum pulchrum]
MFKTKLNTTLSKISESRKWSFYDLQYILLATILTVEFIIIESPSLIPRILLASLFIASFWIPYVRRFTVPALPIFTWLITFYACQFIPMNYRPTHIFVNLLPTLERILYGANLSEIISQHTNPVLDILTWFPYGILHFTFPFIFSGILFTYGPPGSLPVFAKAFGYMNLAGVLTQLFFPNASPWYEIIYGSAPADYSIPGDAGGLLRIDDILGLDLYGTTFGNSPLVFGAFPSLHSGCATIEMLFLSYLFPRMKPIAVAYVMWMWFSTMYLTHHYMIDLVGGSIYAILAYAVAQKFLPKINSESCTRLQYLGVTKSGFRSYMYSMEHNPSDYYNGIPVSTVEDDEESAMKQVVRESPVIQTIMPYRHRPEPLRLANINEKSEDEESPALSPASLVASSGYWSPNSEPASPTTPYSPLNITAHHMHFGFSKNS